MGRNEGSRRDFLKTSVAGVAGATLLPAMVRAGQETTDAPAAGKQERKVIQRTLSDLLHL